MTTPVEAKSQVIGLAGGTPSAGSPLGIGNESGEGLDVAFGGTGGNAKTLVYLIDASGSLIDTLPFVIPDLKNSILNNRRLLPGIAP